MAVYLIGFALSVFLIAISEKRHIKLFAFASVFALLIPCLIAGLRAETIGTDVQVYVTRLTDAAISAPHAKAFLQGSWDIGYRLQMISDYEIGFSLMVYNVAKLTKSLGCVLFVIQALTVVPIYLALARNRKNAPVWLGMLVFYLMFYNATLNMMRQWIAMAFLLLAFQLLTERKYWSTAIFSVIALFFHFSAILVVPIYFIYWFLHFQHRTVFQLGHLKITSRTMSVFAISAIALLAILKLDLVLKVLSAIGIDRFNNYLEGNQISLLVGQIAIRLPPLLLLAFNWKAMRKRNAYAAFYLAMLFLDVVAAQLISVDIYAFRIGHYFLQYIILAVPAMYASQKKGFERQLTVLVIILYCLFLWYYTYILELRHGTYPYAFSFIQQMP